MRTIVNKQRTYARTLATTHAVCSVLGLRTIMEEIGCPQSKTIVFTDNKGNADSIKNPINTRLRHVNMRFHRVRQAVREGDIEVVLMSTKHMLADIFTKCMTQRDFERMRELIMGYGVKPGLPDRLWKRLGYDETPKSDPG